MIEFMTEKFQKIVQFVPHDTARLRATPRFLPLSGKFKYKLVFVANFPHDSMILHLLMRIGNLPALSRSSADRRVACRCSMVKSDHKFQLKVQKANHSSRASRFEVNVLTFMQNNLQNLIETKK